MSGRSSHIGAVQRRFRPPPTLPWQLLVVLPVLAYAALVMLTVSAAVAIALVTLASALVLVARSVSTRPFDVLVSPLGVRINDTLHRVGDVRSAEITGTQLTLTLRDGSLVRTRPTDDPDGLRDIVEAARLLCPEPGRRRLDHETQVSVHEGTHQLRKKTGDHG